MILIGVYKIVSPSGKVYIGQSVNIKQRLNRYKNGYSHKQPRLHNSFNKYGFKNHAIEILCKCSIVELDSMELFYINKYEALGRNGLNVRGDTTSQHKVSDKTKALMRLKAKGFTRETILKGVKVRLENGVSLDTRKKQSESLKIGYATNKIKSQRGKKQAIGFSENHSIIMLKYWKNRDIPESLTQRGKNLSINYMKNFSLEERIVKTGQNKPVNKIGLKNGVVLGTYLSCGDAGRKNKGALLSKINLCCNNKRTKHFGFRWQFA